jgi:RNA polymerase sigma-70 factor (ECF subfamily)
VRRVLVSRVRLRPPPRARPPRRPGPDPGFFARLLEKNDLAAADRTRGRFRSFLLAACQHFLANRHDHDTAKKRGGGRARLPLDFADADGRYSREPADENTAERVFDRQWAVGVLDKTLAGLRDEYVESGRAKPFDTLKECLTGAAEASYADLADQLGMTEGAVKVAVHRLRQRYRDRLRAAIAETVATPEEVDDEIRALFAALG